MTNWSSYWSRPPSKKGENVVRIAFADADDSRVQQAVESLSHQGYLKPLLVGPCAPSERGRLAKNLFDRQQKSGTTMETIYQQLDDSLYHGIALLLDGQVDGLVAGATRPTADVVKAAIRCIGTRPGVKLVSGHFLMESNSRPTPDNTPYLFADCAVVPEPSSLSLALIAKGAAESFHFFTGKEARVALLSFSTRGSAAHPLVDRIKKAVEQLKKESPDLQVDGDLQADAAMDLGVASIKNAGDSIVAGRANVFVFPTLEAGNISYKLVQRFSSEVRIAGPLLWGLNKPVSDLSRGCTVQEIVDTATSLTHLAAGMN